MSRALTLAIAFAVLPLAAWAELRLLMAEQPGCHYCARWHEELGKVYPKTPEGQSAPIEHYMMHDGPPKGITLTRKVLFTPTFILLEDGQEIDRIEGYPGEDFFWGLLGQMIEKTEKPKKNSG